MTSIEKQELAEWVHEVERSEFTCEAGPLYNFVVWHQLRALAGLPSYSENSLQKLNAHNRSREINKRINDILAGDPDNDA